MTDTSSVRYNYILSSKRRAEVSPKLGEQIPFIFPFDYAVPLQSQHLARLQYIQGKISSMKGVKSIQKARRPLCKYERKDKALALEAQTAHHCATVLVLSHCCSSRAVVAISGAARSALRTLKHRTLGVTAGPCGRRCLLPDFTHKRRQAGCRAVCKVCCGKKPTLIIASLHSFDYKIGDRATRGR